MLSSRTTARSAVTLAAIAAAVVAAQTGALAGSRDATPPPTLSLSVPATITPGTATPVSATLSNDADGAVDEPSQRVDFVLSDFAAVTPADITISYPIPAGEGGGTGYVPLTSDPSNPENLDGYYGPKDGFDVSAGYAPTTTDFTVTVTSGGNYRGPIEIEAQLDTVDGTGAVTSDPDNPIASDQAVTQVPKATPYDHVQDVTLDRASSGSLFYAKANAAGGGGALQVAFGATSDERFTSDEFGSGDALPISYRPSTSDFSVAGDVETATGGGLTVPTDEVETAHYGRPGDVPLDFNLPADDGSGAVDVLGVYRPSSQDFYIQGVDEGIHFGRAGDIPLVGNWTGSPDGDSIGVYRPSNSTFYLLDLDSDTTITTHFGRTGDAPVVGDWNGSGDTLIGIHRGNIFYLATSNVGALAPHPFAFGLTSDKATTSSWSFTPGDLVLSADQGQDAAVRLTHLREAAAASAAPRSARGLR